MTQPTDSRRPFSPATQALDHLLLDTGNCGNLEAAR
jgi:hypothetical protein